MSLIIDNKGVFMTQPLTSQIVRYLAVLCVLALAACSTPQVTETDTTERREVPDSLAELPLDTERPIAELADELPDDLKRSELIQLNRAPQTTEGYTLELAKIFYLRGQPAEASELLDRLTFDSLDEGMQRDFALLSAKVELARFNPQASLTWLSADYAPLYDALPLRQQLEVTLLRAQAYSLTNNPIAAARERIFIHPLLGEEDALSNLEAIWLELQSADPDALEALALVQTAPDYTGWLELAALYHEHQNNLPQLARQITRWQSDHPRHPASEQLPDSLVELTEGVMTQPEHIALILPQSGSLSGAGEAVADGFLAGYFSAKNQGQDVPALSFYDETEGDIRQIVRLAAEDGAEFIIGPLGRDQVFRLENDTGMPVNALALNRTDRRVLSNDQVIQFGLAPEDEARQVARQAWQSGHRIAGQIIPEGDWGGRVGDAFADEWEGLGGELVARERIPSSDDGRAYLNRVKALLAIDQSEQRTINIRSVLSGSVEAEPRRRRDLDFIFMAVNPDQGRQLRPLLNFQYAQDIQILSISSLVAIGESERDRDLNGIKLVETPWRLSNFPEQESLQALDSSRYQDHARLYALGLDAFHLLPRLGQLQSNPQASYAGRTGTLRLTDEGQIRRELSWAEFVNGRIQPIEDTDL